MKMLWFSRSSRWVRGEDIGASRLYNRQPSPATSVEVGSAAPSGDVNQFAASPPFLGTEQGTARSTLSIVRGPVAAINTDLQTGGGAFCFAASTPASLKRGVSDVSRVIDST